MALIAAPDVGERVLRHVAVGARFRLDVLVHFAQVLVQLFDDGADEGSRGAFLQLHGSRHIVQVEVREEDESHHPAADEPRGQNHQGHKEGHRGVTELDGLGEERRIYVFYEAHEPTFHLVSNAAPALLRLGIGREVRWQDELGFHQREDEAEHHHPANGLAHLGDRARDEQQRRERHDGGEHAERGRHGHALRADDDVGQRVTVALGFGVNALADDDRVIHHDAKHHDEREQAHGVDGDADGCAGQQHEGAHEGHRQANRHPDGDAQAQEQAQDDEHEGGPGRQVLQHQVDAAVEVVSAVRPDRQLHARRQGGLALCRIIPHRLGDGDLVLGGGGVDGDGQARFAVKEGIGLHVRETVVDGGDVAQPQADAVRARQQHDLLELGARIGLPLGA